MLRRVPRRARRVAVVAGLVVTLVLAAVRLQDRAVPVAFYCLPDERMLVLPVVNGPATWTRVGSLTESADSVVVEVRELRAPVPSATGELIGLVVHLRDPLGARRVIDGATGVPMSPDAPDICTGVRVQSSE